jgi:hypothetical protein
VIEALLVAVVIVAIAVVLWLALRARRAAPLATPRPSGGPGPPDAGTRDPRQPRPQLGAGAVGAPLPLAKRKPTRAVGRRIADR